VRVETKYGSGEVTAYVGAMYRDKDGNVKPFQAHFVLGEEVEMPTTAVDSLKGARTFRQFQEVVDGERRAVVKQVQKYIVEVL
jgi:transposase InsO family protein